tara:strand:- start:1 stop:276 length:276 start_codon:yes stop_codon:yes gene_type:complete
MSGPFKMKNSGLAYSAKQKSPIPYASPAKDGPIGEVKEGFKAIGRALTPSVSNIKRAGSDIKEGFRQLFTGDRTDSRNKPKENKETKKTEE